MNAIYQSPLGPQRLGYRALVILAYLMDRGRPGASLAQLAAHLGVSVPTVHVHLLCLRAAGLIQFPPGAPGLVRATCRFVPATGADHA